ncbi:MAG: thiamine phosphate synthase [Candidatus Omnitrophica bacterium]|nr:thiamine phosphate synthase [Candidatus Omnitrophota bacterium]
MNHKQKFLQKARLYLILDTQVNSYSELLKVARQALRGGVDVVQLRDKNGSPKDVIHFSKHLHNIINRKIPFIMNDRIDLALLCKTDGVHLGQEDVPVGYARKLLGKKPLIGLSCQKRSHMKNIELNNVDYLGLGSVFKTKTKPGRKPMALSFLKKILPQTPLPVFAIGGITLGSISVLKNCGVRRVAVCREIALSKNVFMTTRKFKNELTAP